MKDTMMKDTKVKMSKDESFDSFYGKLNEVVIGNFNLGEKMEDSKIVRKSFVYCRRASV